LLHLAAALALAFGGAGITGCTTTGSSAKADYAVANDQVEANVDATISRSTRLRRHRDSSSSAPRACSSSVGPERGPRGWRRTRQRRFARGRHDGGAVFAHRRFDRLQAGAQTRAEVVLFMTPDSLAKFRESKGWTAGADATVAVAHIGANGMIDSETAKQPIVGFVLNNTGLMAGVSIVGSKYSNL
jgi:hypothetical protein